MGDGGRGRGVGKDEEADGAGHQYVVVVAASGGEAAVGELTIVDHLVAGLGVALDVGAVADGADQAADNQRLGLDVGVESYAHDVAVGEAGLVGTAAAVDVGIEAPDFVEEHRWLADIAVALERVALDDQQRVVVPVAYMGRTPRQQVVVAMAAPLGHHLGLVAALRRATQYGYH